MKSNLAELKKYNFEFPAELIAQKPAHPRDSARLLIYDRKTKKIAVDIFKNIAKYLPPKSLLVLNQTKVIPARLEFLKKTGGRVRGLYLGNSKRGLEFLMDRKIISGEVLEAGRFRFKVGGRAGKKYIIEPLFAKGKFMSVLRTRGKTPIPPYIKHSPLKEGELRREYQTVFAEKPGSVAAPTASLHFTQKLLKDLRKRGHQMCFTTLHVNLGTFAPVTEENIKSGKLHVEEYSIPAAAAVRINKARAEGRKIIAVGTTVVRTAIIFLPKSGKLMPNKGETDLFIRPGYKFKYLDGLVTNFHVPKSSLLMLVSALSSPQEIMNIYQFAIKHKFRLFSFGDGMLIV